MLRAFLVLVAFFVLSMGYASADAPLDRNANAALLYWQAFAQLPRLSDAEEKKLVDEYLTMPLDAHTRELVAKATYALRMMHRGAALSRCEWGMDYQGEGIDTRMPHVLGARVLTSLALLRARIRMEEGHQAEAVNDILDAMALGRHLSENGVLIAVLMGYNLEQRAGETLARFLPKLDRGTIKELPKRHASLPAGGRPATSMKLEELSAMDWLARRFKEPKDTEDLLTLLGFLMLPKGESGDRAKEKGRAFLEAAGGTREGVLKAIDETRSSYERMAKALDRPLDQFEKEFARELAKKAANPVFKAFFPGLENVRRAQARMDVRRALLAAALAIQIDGPDALKDYPDPVMGGPFERVPFEGGYELRSRLQGKDNKPLMLIIGQRGK